MPFEHLQAAAPIVVEQGFVAFGSRKWELFRTLDEKRSNDPIPVLIYPSWEDAPGEPGLIVSWFGWYVGHVEAKSGAHPQGMTVRPTSTANYQPDNLGYWAVFWHVAGLRELPPEKRMAIGKVKTVPGGWRKNAPPRGPELVQMPELLSYET